MSNTIKLELSIINNEIYCEAFFKLDESIKSFAFFISNTVQIDDISCNGHVLSYNAEDCPLVFRGTATKITINEEVASFKMTYHGVINGWHNIIAEDKVLLSYYSTWYPQKHEVPIHVVEVKIKNLENFEVVNAIFDNNVWLYKNDDSIYQDCNIAAFKENTYYKKTQDDFCIYTTNADELKLFDTIINLSQKIKEFYGNIIYNANISKKLSIVSSGLIGQSAYARENLIMMPNLVDSDAFLYSLLGHEIGHFWANGADVSTYDDWLNETCAEWSSLSFMLINDKIELFNKRIDFAIKNAQPVMKPKDLSRPDGTHFTGVSLFYKIYIVYGIETIYKLLRTFYELAIKTTDNYLIEVKNNFSKEIYDIIHTPFK